MEDFHIENALYVLFTNSLADHDVILTIFVNITAISSSFAGRLIERDNILPTCFQLAQKNVVGAAKLLANISRHFPARMKIELDKLWEKYIDFCIDGLPKADDTECSDYLGYIVVNLTTIPGIRTEVAAQHLHKLLPLTSCDVPLKRRLIAVDILRNLSFDDELHPRLLDPADEFLTAILAPLADEADELDDEEIQNLPLGLQYWDKKRDANEIIRGRIVETLYQLCATKIGRTVLRSKGIYPLLRELDKATSQSKMENGALKLLNQEHTLHALIGILIRHEDDMEVPKDLDSIRRLK
uniref:Protein HGH1 homolog n=1 Tax=Acrobeloides nanus TaxID=290746 RepID=A0A914E909_9BILA